MQQQKQGTTKPAVMRTLSLVKGDQQFCFRYQVGDEGKVLESLIEMVNRRELPFDWFDAANGTVRDRLAAYAAGRNDPVGPLGHKEYYVKMDRYCGFAYSELIEQLIASPKLKGL